VSHGAQDSAITALMTTSTSPSAIFAAEPAARPSRAPQPARVATPACREWVYQRERGHGRVRTFRFPLLDWGIHGVLLALQ